MAELNDKALRGVAAVEEMLGAEVAERLKTFALSDGFGAKLTAQALEFAYADSWDENGLSRRERSLILIGALVALRQPNELRNHVALGLANGIAPDELEQILLQLVPYVGFPATSTASAAMREVLRGDKDAVEKETGP
jgi:4-carboxymuconolactone decarboxylase